jgi:hypothetical protein
MNSDAIVETVLGFYPDFEAIYLFGTYQTEGEWPAFFRKSKEAGGY